MGARRSVLAALACAALFLSPAGAIAQGGAEILGGGATGSGQPAWISVEPRFWATFVKTVNDSNLIKEPVFVPMGGASVTLSPPQVPGLSVLVTGLYGQGSGNAASLNTIAPLLLVDAEITRVDVEGLVRYQLPDTTLQLFTGVRYVTFDEKYCATDLDPSCVFSTTSDTRVVILEFGAGGYANLEASGRHRLFGNLTGGVGFRETDYFARFLAEIERTEETEGTLDLNFGYQLVANDWASLSIRYRTFIFFISTNDFGLSDVLLVHGPEIGVGFRF